jgi:DNA-binding transcriptional regulator GbsR (MarR family)
MTTSIAKSEKKGMTEAEWAEAGALWELGEVTLGELSTRFGISRQGMSQGLKKRGVVKNSKARELATVVRSTVVAAVTDQASETAGKFARQRSARIDETKEQHYKWMEVLGRLVMNEFFEAKKANRPFSTADANIRALERAISAIGKAGVMRLELLDANKYEPVEELPELPVKEAVGEEVAGESMIAANDDNSATEPSGLDDGDLIIENPAS